MQPRPEPVAGNDQALLCVVGFPANTGFAWDFLEGLYARVAEHLAAEGIRTFVAYPRVDSAPLPLENSPAEPVELDATLGSASSLKATTDFVRRNGVRAVFLIDEPVFNRRYGPLRRAGVRRIVAYDHASGFRTAPTGLKRFLKRTIRSRRAWMADEVLGVSDFVSRRQVEVGLVPSDRVRTVRNGLDMPELREDPGTELREALGIGPEQAIIGGSGRTAPEKGIDVLLGAFDIACERWEEPPLLVFYGDGPELERLREIASRSPNRAHIRLPGYDPEANALLEGADLIVVPSVWQDALPLAVLGSMARGHAVLATRVGGVPEMIEDGVSGVLVEPRDPVALSDAMISLLADPQRRRTLGKAARARVRAHFPPEEQISAMVESVRPAFEG